MNVSGASLPKFSCLFSGLQAVTPRLECRPLHHTYVIDIQVFFVLASGRYKGRSFRRLRALASSRAAHRDRLTGRFALNRFKNLCRPLFQYLFVGGYASRYDPWDHHHECRGCTLGDVVMVRLLRETADFKPKPFKVTTEIVQWAALQAGRLAEEAFAFAHMLSDNPSRT